MCGHTGAPIPQNEKAYCFPKWIQPLGQQGPLEKKMGTHTSVLVPEKSMDRAYWWATIHGIPKEADIA